jgi:hypothetical protein
MDERVRKLKSPKDCKVFAENAMQRGRPDLANEARQRAVELRAAEYGSSSEVEKECLQAIFAYEETLTEKNGRPTRATRTWQMIKRHGIVAAVERAVCRDPETVGYKALADVGLLDFAFEAVILRHPSLFSEEAIKRSKERMSTWHT